MSTPIKALANGIQR